MDSSFGADLDQNQGGDSNVKRRRAKGEAEGNYVCGCGKVYLSYPALYTHIKTKHDGVTPAGTTQPQSSNKTGRGRPKVCFIPFTLKKFISTQLLILSLFIICLWMLYER